MPFVAALLAGLSTIALPLVIRVLAGIGIGVAAYSGVRPLLDMLLSEVQSNIGALGGAIIQYAAVFNVDRFITIVFSAYVVRLAFMGMSAAGVLTKMQWRGPPAGGA